MKTVVDSDLLAAATAIAPAARRVMIGLTGPPGAGKSTLAARLVDELSRGGYTTAYVPMDGYHLANSQLNQLGLRDRKGAPETFDAAGYVHMLEIIASRPAYTIYAPAFNRDIEEPIAGSIAITPGTDFVVTEGNYLLLDTPPWRDIRVHLDAAWYISIPDGVRRQRLVRRHMLFGKDRRSAEAWTDGSDARNAGLIAAYRQRADALIINSELETF
jgi:pantothenate kinase